MAKLQTGVLRTPATGKIPVATCRQESSLSGRAERDCSQIKGEMANLPTGALRTPATGLETGRY